MSVFRRRYFRRCRGGEARLRFNVISEHTDEEILYALDTLVSCAGELGIRLPDRK